MEWRGEKSKDLQGRREMRGREGGRGGGGGGG